MIFDGITRIAFYLSIIVSGPIITIWALNELFSLYIPLTFESWMAMFWIHFVIVGFDSRGS